MDIGFNIIPLLSIVVIALILMGAYLASKRHRNRLQIHGVNTQGVIVGNKINWGRSTTVSPIVRFTTQNGQHIEAESKYGLALAIPRYAKGEVVNLRYNQQNPYEFDITERVAGKSDLTGI